MSKRVQTYIACVMVAASATLSGAQQTAKPQPQPAPSTAKPQTPPAQPSTAKPTAAAPSTPATARATTVPPTGVALPADYVIGPEDVIGVLFWREAEMSGDVTVRPDGMITLPLLGDIRASGLKPDVLGAQVQQAAGKYLTDANATVVVRQINSRKVFITGEVRTPGAYPLVAPRSVLQLIALAGGLSEYADSENITIMRGEKTLKFNYKDVSKGKKVEQNILLQPNDTILVP